MKHLRLSYLGAVLLSLLLFSTAQAATIVPAFGKWSSATGSVDAGKQNINTMQVFGAVFTKPGGRPTMTMGPASGLVDTTSPQAITGFKNFSGGVKASDVIAKGPIVDPRAYPYGVTLDGATNDQPGMQALVNSLSDGKKHTINLFDKTMYLASVLQLPPGISIINGTIKGSIYIGVDPTEGGTPVDFKNPRIENVNFVQSSLVPGTYAIKYAMAAYAGFVRGCTFTSYDICIWVPTYSQVLTNQFVTRLSILDNKYSNCNYFVRTDKPTNMQFGPADFTISENAGEAKIDNLHLEGLDGLICNHNTFFQEGHNGQSSVKGYNVYIKHTNWVQLTNNQYFEAGLDAIHIEIYSNVSIVGGSIAYPGQRIPSSGVYLAGMVEGGMLGHNSTVTGLTIQWPSLSGIVVDSSAKNISITGNTIYGAGTAVIDGVPQVYYGATDLSTLNHYAIDVNAAAQYISAVGNVAPRNTYNFPEDQPTFSFTSNLDVTGNAVRFPKFKLLTGAETTVDVTAWSQLRLNQSGATNLTVTGTGVEGGELMVVAYNSNTTLKDSGTFKLRGRVDTTVPPGGVLYLRWTIDCWREVSRNYDATTISTTLLNDVTGGDGGSIELNTSGTKVTRNIADNSTVLTVQQLNPTATGYNQIWLDYNGAEIAHIDKTGYIVSAIGFKATPITFSALGSVASAGVMKYCSNCTTASVCASGGSGHWATSNGTNWTCN